MPVTPFQRKILKLLARQRIERGESYVAGGVALNLLLEAQRSSRDIDLFHDTAAALSATWAADRKIIEANGYEVRILREAPSFVEALIVSGDEITAMQWARDSAYRFFPLVVDETLGLALHSFDLATNKVLAMAGRLEVRDWVDAVQCASAIQPFGYLLWAACGKDPGYNPRSLLSIVRRQHYSQSEVDTLDFGGARLDAAQLGVQWHDALSEADNIVSILPASESGKCVLSKDGQLFRGDSAEMADALKDNGVLFHKGCIGGSFPALIKQ